MVGRAKAGGTWGVPLRLRTIRLSVLSVFIVLAAVTAVSAPALAATKPLPISVGHTNPVVTTTADQSRGVTETIGSAGGTLTTTAANGTVFTLTLPRNALAGDEMVSMTPLLTLTGGGLRLAAGVQLGPEGLHLLKPGTLGITPAKPTPKNQQVAFGFQTGGKQFGLVPLAAQNAIQIPLISLDGVGLGRANGGQLSGRVSHPPSDPESAFLTQLAAASYQIRRHHSAAAAHQEILGTLAGYYQSFVKTALTAPGSSITAWARAVTRSAGWQNAVQVLGYARRFPGDAKLIKSKVFQSALHKRWRILTGSCNGGRGRLGNLQKALQLGRVAQIRGTGSLLGGTSAITAGIDACGQLGGQATLGPTTSNWQSGLKSPILSQVGGVVSTGATPLLLQSRTGDNEFDFASGQAPISERLTSWTLSPMYAGQCSNPSFVSFTTDPSQLYASFNASLTVPPDLFVAAKAPPSRIKLTVVGADMANWSTTCPQPVPFTQAPAAMAGLTAVTTFSPVNLDSSKSSVKFQGSANIVVGATPTGGGTITGFANENGSVSVRFPR
jgi:hypothetical protein